MANYPSHGAGPPWDSLLKSYLDDLDVRLAGSPARAVLDSVVGSATGLEFFPENYAAVGDGVADDTVPLQAALDAAFNAGGGVVLLSAGVYRITGEIIVKANVSLRGQVSTMTAMNVSTIKLDSATARVNIGSTASARGGASGNFNIDGNNTGDPTGALFFRAIQQTLDRISINEAGGVGFRVDASQNCFVHSVDVNLSGSDNVVIDGGSGGMLFSRCEWSSATGWDLRITESNPGGHPTYGYQFGPTDIEFHKCLMENYTSGGAGMALIESGTRITFRMCGFSVNNVTITGGSVVKITNDSFPATLATQVEFNSCNLNGGVGQLYPIFHVGGLNTIPGNRLVVSGAMFYQQTAVIYQTDGATEGRLNADELTSSVTARFSATGAGSFAKWLFQRHTGLRFLMEDPTGAWTDSHPLILGRRTDAGARMWVDRDGTINWGNGSGFTSQASVGKNTANTTVSIAGMTLSARKVEAQTDFVVPSASYALTTNVSTGGPLYGITITGSSSIASWTISNPVNLQQITLLVYRSGAQAVTWPTNVRFASATAPPLAADTRTYITFQYLSGTGLWYEMHRAADVPNS